MSNATVSRKAPPSGRRRVLIWEVLVILSVTPVMALGVWPLSSFPVA